MSSRIYLDYAAATPLDASVKDAMRAWEDVHFENAFSTHTGGKESKRALEDARFALAKHLEVKSNECFFTDGATDASVKAVNGSVNALLEHGVAYRDMHIIISAIEHSSMRSCAEALVRKGVHLSVAPVSDEGIIDVERLAELFRDTTVFVAVMLVNNELGTLQPVRDIARALREHYEQVPSAHVTAGMRKPSLIVDASQAVLSMSVHPNELGADMCVIDAQKIYGPKRTGLLYVKSGTPFLSLCGAPGKTPHEGTPDVARAIGMRVAYDKAEEHRLEDTHHWKTLKTYFTEALTERFPSIAINGSVRDSVPHIINISFSEVEGEYLTARLDAVGIAASAKSACLSEGGEGSYVVQAVAPQRAHTAVRFSFGRSTTQEDLDVAISALVDIVRSQNM